jgi:hypothetical protein
VHPSAAPWFAALAFGADGGVNPEAMLYERLMLPQDHPLRQVPVTGLDANEVEPLAAALQRPGTALQIRMATTGDIDDVTATMDLARRASLLRPRLDLLQRLRDHEFSRLGIAGDGGSAPADPLSRLQNNRVRQALSSRRILRSAGAEGILPIASENEWASAGHAPAYGLNLAIVLADDVARIIPKTAGAARWQLAFLDVPLAGNAKVAAEFRATAKIATAAEIVVLDQKTGAELAKGDAVVAASGAASIDIDLPALHGMVCIIVRPRSATVSGQGDQGLSLVALTIE